MIELLVKEYPNRIQNLQETLRSSNLDGLILNPGTSLIYFTGLHFHLSERPVVFLLPQRGEPVLILPELELQKVKDLNYPLKTFSYGDNPKTWKRIFIDALNSQAKDAKIGVEPRSLRYLELELINRALPSVEYKDASNIISKFRSRKSDVEISYMKQAVEIAEKAFLETLKTIRPGQTEKQIATRLMSNIFEHGSDTDLPFTPIVASGPNGANPHAVPSNRIVNYGDVCVIDWGASVNGYKSDITRNVSIGTPSNKMQEINEIVMQANVVGRETCVPGVSFSSIDSAARVVIEDAGYGNYFIHRTGHGLGLDGHEEPYVHSDNHALTEVGNAITIEPGIYIPGLGGIRIEDDVIITTYSSESLTNLDREIYVVE